jgi:hypothetical protein
MVVISVIPATLEDIGRRILVPAGKIMRPDLKNDLKPKKTKGVDQVIERLPSKPRS